MQFTYSKNEVYMHDAGRLVQYADGCYKLTQFTCLRLSGFESEEEKLKRLKGTAGNSGKLRESLSRSRSRVYDIALANPWEMFVTMTGDAQKQNRYLLAEFSRTLRKWVNNFNFRNEAAMKYLIVPEPHKDGAWHFHGLMMGIPQEQLTEFKLSDNIPKKLKDLICEGRKLFNWPTYADTFGWTVIEPVINHERCASYISKYITKQLLKSSLELNVHTYYCSQGLKRGDLIYQGELRRGIESPDYENEYVKVKRYSSLEEPINYFCDKEDNDGTINSDG